MAYSPQDVYAKHLVSGRGYPLWTPEPNMSLPETYVREGLKIGDVGVVVPEDGSFDVFFNVCLPPTHVLHRETGVPNNFSPIPLSERDISKFPEAERAGRIISSTSVARVKDRDSSDEDPESRSQPGPLNYEFTLSSQEGAILILPEGAERYYLRNERLFLDKAIQHAIDWYTFAEQRLGRIISHDSLYLISGFYKAPSWSLAAYQHGQGAGTPKGSAQFKAVQVGRGNGVSYTWETTQAMDWRAGPSDQYYNGIANQTVFIHGFKIAVREGILGTKWVNVKVDLPSVRPRRVEFSSGSWLSNLLGGTSGDSGSSTAIISKGATSALNMDSTGSNLPADENDAVPEDVTIHRFPHVMKPFHPSDIINQYLLRKVPSATVAVTHDSQWTRLLEKGLLKPEELSQEDHLTASVIDNYSMVLTHGDAVYLQSTVIENDNGAKDDDVTVVQSDRAGQTSGEATMRIASVPSVTSLYSTHGSDPLPTPPGPTPHLRASLSILDGHTNETRVDYQTTVDSASFSFAGLGDDASDNDSDSPTAVSSSAGGPFDPIFKASGSSGQQLWTVMAKPVATNNFITKLYRMLNVPISQPFITWTELGTSFVVSNVAEFSRGMLASHFKHNNFSSFVRQLNMYGFHKINRTPRAQRTPSSQTWEFSHPKFLRGRPDLLEEIKRKVLEPEPREKNCVESPGEVARALAELREENRALWREVRSLNSRIPPQGSPAEPVMYPTLISPYEYLPTNQSEYLPTPGSP